MLAMPDQLNSPSRREFLSAAAVSPLLAPLAAQNAPPSNALFSRPRLGAEFFLNSTETRDPCSTISSGCPTPD